MEGKKQDKKSENNEIASRASVTTGAECKDSKCPFHGKLSTRGRSFKGRVIRLHHKRAVVGFERFIFIRKYERYARKKTRLHAHLPDCLAGKIEVGDYVGVIECRPLSKIIHHVVASLVPREKTREKSPGESEK